MMNPPSLCKFSRNTTKESRRSLSGCYLFPSWWINSQKFKDKHTQRTRNRSRVYKKEFYIMTRYKIKKAETIQAAQEWQTTTATTCQSWQEIAESVAHFEKLARRYGLIKEFKENGII